MNAESSVKVFADASRNELRISFVGVIKASDMPRYEVEIGNALQTLRAGFALLTDLTDLSFMEMGCVPSVERTMDLLGRSEVRLVVRVIPDQSKDIGMSIMSLFHYPRGLKIVTTESREAAALVLQTRE